MVRRTIVAAVLLLCAPRMTSAADAWVQVTSLHFTVVSNAGDKRAREVAWQFEQIRAAMKAIWPWVKGDLDRPVLVVAAKDENTMKLLVPEYWEKGSSGLHPSSVLATGLDRHYIALQADARADDTDAINPYYGAYWSYTALILDASFERDLPLWLRDGLAGVMSNTIVREKEIRLGMAPPWYVRTMATESRLRLQQLLTMDDRAAYYRNPATRDHFDAQTWALTHYLLFGAPDLSGRLDGVIKAVMAGTPSLDAFQQAFGPLEAMEAAYLQHVRKQLIPYSRLKTETLIEAKAFGSRPLPEADALMSRAALHAVTRRSVEAKALIAEARRGGDPAAAYEVEGVLAAVDGGAPAMRAALAKAEERGSTNFYTYYQLGLGALGNEPNASDVASAERRLRKAVELNPFHPGAHAGLAIALSLGSDPSRAIPVAQKALSLAPRDFFTRVASARAFWNAGQRDVATAQARAAVGLATDDGDRRQAREMLDAFLKAAAPR
jgi:tetratricopeptide (TPR) repeat protein